MKLCSTCKELKPLDCFWWKNRKKGYLQPTCKVCNAAISKDYVKAKYERRRALVNRAKDKPCMDCGVKYPPYVMDFDHRESQYKSFNIGTAVSSASLERLLREIVKCDVVCANCHRERTHSGK